MTETMRSRRLAAVTAGLLLALPALAMAHTGTDAGLHHDAQDAAGALAAGFAHPFSGLDHLAAMVALGLWSAMTARRAWIAPLAFAGTLLVGALLGLAGVTLPVVEPMIAVSLLALGLLLASNARLPAAAGALMAAGFALFHGLAHGAELAGPTAAFALIGMVAATALLHGAGIGIGLLLRSRAAWLPRVAGTAVALFGIALLVN